MKPVNVFVDIHEEFPEMVFVRRNLLEKTCPSHLNWLGIFGNNRVSCLCFGFRAICWLCLRVLSFKHMNFGSNQIKQVLTPQGGQSNSSTEFSLNVVHISR